MNAFRRRLAGTLATLGLLAFVVGVPLVLLWARQYVWTSSWSEIRARAQMPDDGTLLVMVVQVVAWLAWAYLTVGLVIELVARVRRVDVPHLRGFGFSQASARHVLDVAALLFAAVPTVTAFAAPPATGAAVALAGGLDGPTVAVAGPVSTPAPPVVEPVETTPPPAPAAPVATVDYTVRRGDSLWKIAERFLGDGRRHVEIIALNSERLGTDPGFLEPGWVLRVPAASPGVATAQRTHVVKPGETLSGIAAEELGDAERYPEIFEASRETVQPDGERLTDPDLIRPGWTLTVPAVVEPVETTASPAPAPAPAPAVAPAPAPAPKHAAPSVAAPVEPTPPRAASPTPAPTPAATSVPGSGTSATSNDADHAKLEPSHDQAQPAWLVPGLTGSGAFLAGGLLLTIRARRRAAARRREIGRMLPPLPSELQPTAATAAVVGAETADVLTTVAARLDHLAIDVGDPAQLPPVLRAVVAGDQVTLYLSCDADPAVTLPAPRQFDGTGWTAPLAAEPVAGEPPSPYPLLVPVGLDDEGHQVMVNLERLQTVRLEGDQERVAAFARYVAAQVALNPWSSRVRVLAVGALEELADIDPLRFKWFPEGDTSAHAEVAAAIDVEGVPTHDPDQFYLLVIARTDGAATELALAITGYPARPGVVMLTLGGPGLGPGEVPILLEPDGRLLIPAASVDVVAPGLTSEEAAACARITALSDVAESVPVPTDDEATSGWRSTSDLAGALRPQLTRERPSEPVEPAVGAVLSAPTSAYVAAAPVTATDVSVMAPVVGPDVREEVEAQTSSLDQDLADFADPACLRPKLRLLGPIELTALAGDRGAIHYRERPLTELLAYLLLHPSGVTLQELADKDVANPKRLKEETSELRTWLGMNKRTGRPFLPHANQSGAARQNGLTAYQVEDVLCDYDLFCALRTRGTARGADGIDDLVTALDLVTGIPFTRTERDRYTWLFEGERFDHIATVAILDVATTVFTHAMEAGDLELARRAVGAGHRAAPDDEQMILNHAAVTAAEGHNELAARMLREGVTERVDDYRSPAERKL